jgi:hypothetical protein
MKTEIVIYYQLLIDKLTENSCMELQGFLAGWSRRNSAFFLARRLTFGP